ncbi:uncharacterized protein LOC125179547 [Hyalella azteca]|uniref:Uncharacterized protein LOC125179547 n=1 Tax=Hyalella azteca TaxID=294128 RepID=A0A979FYF8_HYAAZ|nr:uncharacterized protein LOC125179547 [Hyalella azteca]
MALALWLRGIGSCVAALAMSTDVIYDVGDFYGILGKGLTASQVFVETQVERTCECRMRCFVHTACVAFSVRPHPHGALVCGLARENVYVNRPGDVPGASYFVRKQLVEPWAIDRLIYRRLTTQVQGYAASKAACEAIPGFRLIAVMFEAQMSILLELCLGREPNLGETQCEDRTRWFYVDMVKINNVPMIRGEIPLSETDISSVHINDQSAYFLYAAGGMLHDDNPTTWKSFPVCQANVFAANW